MSSPTKWDIKEYYCKFLKKHFKDIPRNQNILMPPFGKGLAGDLIQPKWDLPDKVVLVCAVTGGQVTKEMNPNQPYTPEEIAKEGIAALDAGATGLHVHVRDEKGVSISDAEVFRKAITPIIEKYPVGPKNILDLGTHGAIPEYPTTAGEVLTHTEALVKTLAAEVAEEKPLIEVSPFRPCPQYHGDELVLVQVENSIAHVEFLQEHGIKPQIVIYDHGSVDACERYFIKTGILEPPFNWLILDGLPSTSALYEPENAIYSLLLYKKMIDNIDRKYGSESIIIVGESGRAGAVYITLAMLLGLHVRVGMEDAIFLYPHKDEKITTNAQCVQRAKAIAEALGREVATANDYRKLTGLPLR